MAADLNQELYLAARGLPPGLNMTITDVKLDVPGDKKWKVSFERYDVGSVAINENGTFDHLSGKYPITVSTSTAKGLIGRVKFGNQQIAFHSGTGGSVVISIRIEGTTTINGNSYTVDQKGYISVSASDWGQFERPDYSNISYYWGDSPPFNLSIEVPATISGMPADAYFVFGLSADGKQIGVNTTVHKEILDEVTDNLLKGIFFFNEQLVGWAIKPV